MKKPSKFDTILNLWISLIINVVLSIVLPLAAIGFISLPIFLKGFALAFTVSTLIVFVVPIVDWGAAFALKCGARPMTLRFTLLSTLVLAFCLGTFMSLLMTAVNAGMGPHFMAAWLSCYHWVLLSVYMSAVAGIITGVPLTKKLCGLPN